MNKGLITATALLGGACLASRFFAEDYDFRGKVVIITGGSRGLGLCIARELAAEGARLAILARDCDELKNAVNDLAVRGAETLGIPCDLRDPHQVKSAMKRVEQFFGGVDVLINNAGTIAVGPLDHMTRSDFEEAMNIHFWAPLYAIQAVIPVMRIQGHGRIVNISSIGGLVGVPHLAPYCASKFALVGLSEALHAELAEDNIRVTTVCPGLMRTGSHFNARFKGRHHEEFTWFALFDALPVTSISAIRAARQVVNACRRGDAMSIITIQAKLATFVHGLFPNFFASCMTLMGKMLPAVSLLHDGESRSGWESRSEWAPSMLTRLADQATQQNNQTVARGATV